MIDIINISYSVSLAILNIVLLQKNFMECKRVLFFLLRLSKINKIKEIYINDKRKFSKLIYLIMPKLLDNVFFKDFVFFLINKNMFLYINYIIKFFIEMYKKKKKLITVIIYTCTTISSKNKVNIKKLYIKKFCNFNLNFIFRIDKKLIAGFKIYINDLVYDSSLINSIKINFCSKE